MELTRNSSIDVIIEEIIRRSLSFSSKDEEIIEKAEVIIDEKDPNKLLEKCFNLIRRKNL